MSYISILRNYEWDKVDDTHFAFALNHFVFTILFRGTTLNFLSTSKNMVFRDEKKTISFFRYN